MTNQTNTLIDQSQLDIILDFEKKLEQLFGTETQVIISKSSPDFLRLAIQIESNFSLSEAISLFKMHFKSRQENHTEILAQTSFLFQNAVYNLNLSLTPTIEIDEISIYFKKTAITVYSTERNSILEEFEFILKAIVHHFEHYSTLMGQIPNEIHIPVIDDQATQELFKKNNTVKPVQIKSPYSKFWGLYFDALNRPMIYNLERTNIIPGDLDLYLDD